MKSYFSNCYAAVALIFFSVGVLGTVPNEKEVNAEYWKTLGHEALNDALKMQLNNKVAKNVIFFLGDGMGIPTVTAMRIYKGQKANKTGEEEQLAFDKFPYVSLAKTYALDRQNPDSANTATAFLCGVKTNFGTLGVDGRVPSKNCEASLDNSTHVTSILQWAQEAGKWTGFVTSTRVTHATPAALYAHSASRDWEAGSPDERCDDITTQLVHGTPGKDIRVIFGGGRMTFLPKNINDIEGKPGTRNDSRNLLFEWAKSKERTGQKAKEIFDYEGLEDLDTSTVDYVLGLFHSDHLPYVADRIEQPIRYPTLVELTKKAISILKRGPDGFFLLVEGGRIDMAHHSNLAYKAMEEGYEFDQAIQAAVDMTNIDDTLIVVTADHSHTLTIGGDYPKRGNNILGLGGISNIDNLTITTLTYANGPGYKQRNTNLTQEEVLNKEYKTETAYPLKYETHGAEDVSVHARGPMAHLFHGVHEQSYIPYVMGHALNVLPCPTCGSNSIYPSLMLTSVSIFALRYF